MKLAKLVASCFLALGGAQAPWVLAQSDANLSIGAGSDGSSKASGTSFGNVRDGDLSSFWSPNESTGRISIKFQSEQSVSSARIIEASGSEGTIGDWELIDHNKGDVLATGSGAGTISFSAVSLKKISFIINSASGTPKVAEFETFTGSAVVEPTLAPTPTPTPTAVPSSEPTATPTPAPTVAPTATPAPTQAPVAGNGDCDDLINNSSINWRESSLDSDQEIVECLKESLGQPVGFGEKATGGFNAAGGSKLVVITNDNPEQQILDAISSPEHTWIVFDKDDFARDTLISMHRLDCGDASVLNALGGASEAECRDPFAWCSANGVSSGGCLEEFYNNRLDDKALPIRNKLIDSNTTLDGRGSKAFFMFNGFKIGADSSGSSTHVSSNVIVTNLDFRGAGHTEDHGLDPDMLRVTGESHDVWIHQNTFDTTGDAAFDIKVGGFATTISFNKLINVKRASLHGSSDSRAINEQITSTMHNNLFITDDASYASNVFNGLRRVPLLRRGQTHLWNNVFYNYRKDITSIRVGGRMLFEDNLVLNNFEQAQTKSDELDDFTGDGLFDFREGGLEVKNSDVFFADANCDPIGSPASLDQSLGSTPDMNSAYNSASRNTIGANRFPAGTDLLNYVKATAGKGGKTPFVSSRAQSASAIISGAPSSCQP